MGTGDDSEKYRWGSRYDDRTVIIIPDPEHSGGSGGFFSRSQGAAWTP